MTSEQKRLARSEDYLGKDRDELREIILDRDEEIELLRAQLRAELKWRRDNCND